MVESDRRVRLAQTAYRAFRAMPGMTVLRELLVMTAFKGSQEAMDYKELPERTVLPGQPETMVCRELSEMQVFRVLRVRTA
jgi:hypothetical protein